MNYELLLDEIMVNAVAAKELVAVPGREIFYGVCPLQLEYHTSIFLAGALLAFGQKSSLIFLVQVDALPQDIMVYTGELGPHFGKRYSFAGENVKLPFPEIKEKVYSYLDKLFAYVAVLNNQTNHKVIFVKKGVKVGTLSSFLKQQIRDGYSLLVMSNVYQNMSSIRAKELSKDLIAQCKAQVMDPILQEQFPAFACLHTLCQDYDGSIVCEHLMNTADIGLDPEKSTSLRCMLR